MNSGSTDTPPPQPTGDSGTRLRSVPYRTPYVWAAILVLLNYCGGVAFLTSLTLFFLKQTPTAMHALVGSIAFYAVSGIASFLKRRHVLCPLCKGTPLVSTRAHVHTKAFRIFPLDHATSATLTLLFTQTFRCMYCGARFDLLKPRPERKLLQEEPRQDNLS